MGDLSGNSSSHFSGVPREVLYFMNGGDDWEIPLESVEAPLSVNDVPKIKSIESLLLAPKIQRTNSREDNASRQNLEIIPSKLPAQATQSPANDEATKTNVAAGTLPESELQSIFRQLMTILDKNPRLDVDSEDGKSLNGEFTRLAFDIYFRSCQEAIDKIEETRTSELKVVGADDTMPYLVNRMKEVLERRLEITVPSDILESTQKQNQSIQLVDVYSNLIANWQCDLYQYINYKATEPFFNDLLEINNTVTEEDYRQNYNNVAAATFQMCLQAALTELREEAAAKVTTLEQTEPLEAVAKVTTLEQAEPLEAVAKVIALEQAEPLEEAMDELITPQQKMAIKEELDMPKRELSENEREHIKNLQDYRDERNAKEDYYHFNAFSFFNKKLGIYNRSEKTGGANKVISLLENTIIIKDFLKNIKEFSKNISDREFGALQQGKLGNIVESIIEAGVLPKDFFEQVANLRLEAQTPEKQSSYLSSFGKALLIFIPTFALIADCFLSGMDFVEALI